MKSKWNLFVVFALLVMMMGGAVTPAQAAEGDLNLTFGIDGLLTTDVTPLTQWWLQSTIFAQQSDGRIIVGGNPNLDIGDEPSSMLERYSANGTLDEGFGEQGRISPLVPDAFASVVTSVLIDPQDGIIVVGSFSGLDDGHTRVFVTRYNSEGIPVTGFGEAGVLKLALPDQMSLMASLGSALQDDGKIIISGAYMVPDPDYPQSYTQGSFIMRLTSGGEIDTTFGQSGMLLSPVPYALAQITLKSDGKILVSNFSMYSFPTIASLTSDGEIDTSFGVNGSGSATPFSDLLRGSVCRGLAEGPDGKIYLASESGEDFFLGRLNPDGSPDTDYSDDGYVTLDFAGAYDMACSVLVQPDGKVIVGGGANTSDLPGFAMVRFNEDGTLDTSFGSDGKVLTTSTTRALFGIFQLSMTPGGKLLAGGIEYGSNGTTITTLARYDLIETGDSTSPTITPNIQGTLGTNDWYTSDVTLSWSVVDDESAFTSSGCDPVTISADQQDTSYTCEATSEGGTNSVTVSIKRDATGPVLAPSVTPNPVLLNSSATASPNASDATSAVASAICGPVITNSVGEHSVTCAATDNAGNTSSSSATYTVTYKFIGFSQPVDNNGVLNIAKAGQAIPLKFRITDANGSPVINLAGITATSVGLACAAGTTTDLIEEYTSGSSGLQNLGDGYYQWNWKTLTTYANSCKTLRLDLGEGLYRTALFQFRK